MFKEEIFKAPYKDEEREFKIHYRPLWDWTLDQLNGEKLAPHFVWDTQRLYKYNSGCAITMNLGLETASGRYKFGI